MAGRPARPMASSAQATSMSQVQQSPDAWRALSRYGQMPVRAAQNPSSGLWPSAYGVRRTGRQLGRRGRGSRGSRLVLHAQSAELKLPAGPTGVRVSGRTRCTTASRAPGISINNPPSGTALRSGSAAGTVEASSVDLMAPIILSRHGGATRSAWVLRTQLVPADYFL